MVRKKIEILETNRVKKLYIEKIQKQGKIKFRDSGKNDIGKKTDWKSLCIYSGKNRDSEKNVDSGKKCR